MLFDLPLEELRVYQPKRDEPSDFDEFWQKSLAETQNYPINGTYQPADFGFTTIDCYDVTFSGYKGQPIKGWLLLPKNAAGPLPCIVEYIGYGGGRGYPWDWLLWCSAGYANFIMDTRGQGSVWSNGDTPDISPEGGFPEAPGFMTRGVLDPNLYYFKRLFIDAVRAVQTIKTHPLVDGSQIILTGGSQGGGIVLAVAGLVPNLLAVMPDVPFLCHFRRATTFVDSAPYNEIAGYLKIHRDKVDQVFSTLSYFDGMNFAVRSSAKALFSVGLMDETCPPSTVFAAYNHYAGEKEIRVWEFNDHEGGGSHQKKEKLEFLRTAWKNRRDNTDS